MAGIDEGLPFHPLRIAVLTVSDTRAEESDKSGALLVERLTTAGHSFVGAVELAPQPKVKTILQFGESGDPSSPHWFDQAPLYAKKQFKQAWYAKADVEAHSERHYHPGELATAGKPRVPAAGDVR